MNNKKGQTQRKGVIRILITIKRWELITLLILLGLGIVGYQYYSYLFASSEYEIDSELAGNFFPSQIISTAATDDVIILPTDTPYVGRSQNTLSIRIRSHRKNSKVRIEINETPFFKHSVSEFILPKAHTTYTVYPDIAWDYEALRQNDQATPVSFLVQVSLNGHPLAQKLHTMSMRSIGECLLGYYHMVEGEKRTHFVNTRILFAAYVNEDNPSIDKLLQEALNTRIVNRFTGYQTDSAAVIKQVYALWNVLQRRHFHYSSISQSSLSSNVVYAQRIRTFDDALQSSQINCVDGSVLFASLLRATGIDPILVRLPAHMFVGFYTDREHRHANYLETTMIGDVNLDDFFPEENLDSTLLQMSQNQASRMTFDKSMVYASKLYYSNMKNLQSQATGYMLLGITDGIRRKIHTIGK